MTPTRAAPMGPRNGQARQRERSRGGDQCRNVGIILHVVRQHVDDDLRFVLEAVDEQRADRAIDETRRQRLLLGRPAFTLEVAARNLAGGVGLLLVVDGEREEIDAGFRALGAHDGRENARLAVLRKDCGVGLPRHVASFELKLAPAPFDFHAMNVEHVRSFGSISVFGRLFAVRSLARTQQAPRSQKGRRSCLSSPTEASDLEGAQLRADQRRMPSLSMIFW